MVADNCCAADRWTLSINIDRQVVGVVFLLVCRPPEAGGMLVALTGPRRSQEMSAALMPHMF